jgi:hypothetical protein
MPRLRARGLVTAGTCIPAAVVSKRETIEKHRYSGALHSALPPWRATPLANLVGDPFTTAVGAATVASGGGTPGPPVTTVVPQPPQQQSSVFNASHSSIRAVIISGLSDPAKVIASPNVTVTGGIVALGKLNTLGSIPSAWSPGLRILPDYALLTGAKIPPVTPDITDVRIVRQQTTADFPPLGF